MRRSSPCTRLRGKRAPWPARRGRSVGVGVVLAAVTCAGPALADHGAQEPSRALLGLLTVAVLLALVGLAFGCMSAAMSHLFRRRTAATLRVLRARPGWSLLTGVGVTLLGLALLALLRPAPPLQLVVLLGWLVGLATFAVAAATRLASRAVNALGIEEEIPDVRTLLASGLLLLGLNAVPVVGSLLFLGIVLAAIGASLLGYFLRRGDPTAAPAAPQSRAREQDGRPDSEPATP